FFVSELDGTEFFTTSNHVQSGCHTLKVPTLIEMKLSLFDFSIDSTQIGEVVDQPFTALVSIVCILFQKFANDVRERGRRSWMVIANIRSGFATQLLQQLSRILGAVGELPSKQFECDHAEAVKVRA